MARIDERFEGTGYQNTWTEGVGAGCTVDEDASPGDVSQPNFWDRQCLKIIKAGGVAAYTYNAYGDQNKIFTRASMVVTAKSVTEGQSVPVVEGLNGPGSVFCWLLAIFKVSGVDYWALGAALDGANLSVYTGPACSLNTRYLHEIKWDTTNDLCEWKVNGSSQFAPASLVAGHVLNGITLLGDSTASANSFTAYYDLVAMDDTDWVGDEGQPAVKRYAGVPFKYLNKGVW
jgi:hypothetical protein